MKALKNIILPIVLAIGGHDPGGGAGIQADLKTFQAHGVFGMTAITAVTVQNTRKVYNIQEMRPEIVRGQISCLFDDIEIHALKIGMVSSTVLIETILAAFEMDEILYVLRDYIVGLNCGRWDYIFSFIKKFQKFPDFVLPDRGQVTMTTHFLRSYSQLSIKTCHRRGAMAIGGMAAQIPIKGDPEANEVAIGKVVQDKEREAGDGHDGTWVAHPGLVPVAKEVFDKHMPGPNQLDRLRRDVEVSAADLLKLPEGTIEHLLKPENRDQLTAILTYHVVPGKVYASDVVKLDSATTVNGADITIRSGDNGVSINDARVVKTDIGASNGVIHIIDTVILPR